MGRAWAESGSPAAPWTRTTKSRPPRPRLWPDRPQFPHRPERESMQLEGKKAIITGAATGIGAVTSRLFAREGAGVVVADINEEQGEQTVADIRSDGGEAHFLRADVTVEGDVSSLVKEGADLLG